MRPTDLLEDDVLQQFETLMRHVAGSHAPEFLGVDLTMSQAKVLYLVSLRPGVSMSVLAGELGIGASAASGLVDRLVSLGHLGRRESLADRRQQLLTISDSGSAALDQMRELRTEVMRRLLRGLARDELEALRGSLAALDREVLHLDQTTALQAPEARPERTTA